MTLQGEAVEVAFSDVDLAAGWTVDLRQELRTWRLDRWEITWWLPTGADPPRRVRWLDDVQLVATDPNRPEIQIGSRHQPGFGVLPGVGRQTLSWSEGEVRLDGVVVGPWSAPRRTSFNAVSDDPFRLTSVRLRFLPR